MFANSKGSGETALMRRLARAFVGRLCNVLFSHMLAYLESKLVCGTPRPSSYSVK